MKYEVVEQAQVPKITFGRLKEDVTFIMSMPRLAFSDNMYSLQNATYNLGLYGNRHGGAFWEQGIENLLEDAIGKGYKYALSIDYDTFYNSYHIIELYNLMEENPEVGAMFPLQPSRGKNYPLAAYFMDDFGHTVKTAKGNFKNGIIPCDTGHFGLTMIRLSELSKLKKPWFESLPNKEGNWRRRHKDADVHFWIKCKKAGIKVCLAEVWIGHLQLMCSWCGQENARFVTIYQHVNDILDGGIPEWAIPKSYKLFHSQKKGVSKMTTEENPKCELCGADKPTKVYNPNTPGFPTKRVRMCDECAVKSPKAEVDLKASGLASDEPEKVPDITPAVPEVDIAAPTKEFGPKLSEPLPVADTGNPIIDSMRADVEAQKKDLQALAESRKKLLDQLQVLDNTMIAKRGAIAGLQKAIDDASKRNSS